MTFIVNQWGKVYECNLGDKSAEIATAMTDFNPDARLEPRVVALTARRRPPRAQKSRCQPADFLCTMKLP